MSASRRLAEPDAAPPAIFVDFAEACRERHGFIEHLRLTSSPETFPGLCHDKPPPGAVFRLVVRDFHIGTRAGSEMIRCAACATEKKFKRGCLAYYPDECVLRVIGNACGDEQRSFAEADFRLQQKLRLRNDYLLEHLPGLQALISRANALRDAADHAQEMSAKARSKAKTFCETILRSLHEGDGSLTVVTLGRSGNSRTDSIRSVVHRPQGADFLRPLCRPRQRLDEALIRLREANRGDEEEAFDWQSENSDNLPALDACYANLRAGKELLDRAVSMIEWARDFLDDANLKGIDDWAHQAGFSRVRATREGSFIRLAGPEKSGVRHHSAALQPRLQMLSQALRRHRVE